MEKQEVLNQLEGLKSYKAPVFGADSIQIPNYLAIRTVEEDKPIAILGEGYSLLNHYDAAKQVFDELDANVLNYKIRNLTTNDEKRMSMTIGFPEMEFDVDGSEIEPTLTLCNSVDGTLRYSKIFGYLRLVCTNGLMVGEKLFSVRKKHTVNFEIQEFDYEQIMTQNEKFKGLIEKSQTARITNEFKKSLVNSGFPQRVIENWNQLFEKYDGLYNESVKGNTIWAIQAVLTNWLSNVVAKTNINRANTLSMALNKKMTEYIA